MGLQIEPMDGFQPERYHSRRGKKRRKGGGGAAQQPSDTPEAPETEEIEESEVEESAESTDNHSEAEDQTVDTAPAEEVGALKAELASEREQRTALEARLEKLEARLKEAESRPAPETVTSADALGLATLQAQAAAELEAQEQRVILDTWLLENQLRAEEEVRAQEQLASTASILELHQPRESMDERLQSARVAVDAAENRAAEQARKVKSLTRELEDARAEQARTASRLQEIEARLDQADARAAAVLTDQLAPTQPIADTASTLIEEPPVEEVPTAEVPVEEAPTEDAPTDIFDESPFDTPAPAVEVAEETAPADEAVDFAAALEGWGSEDIEEAPKEEAQAEAAVLEVDTEPEPPILEEEPEDSPEEAMDLSAALEGWGAEEADEVVVEVETPQEEAPAPVVDEEPDGEDEAETSTLADELTAWGAEESDVTLEEAPASEEASPAEPAEETPEQPEPDVAIEPEIVEAEEPSVDEGADESQDEPMVIAADAKDGTDSMMDALANWGNMDADAKPVQEDQEEPRQETPAPKPAGEDQGKEAMLDALMRFMGPK